MKTYWIIVLLFLGTAAKSQEWKLVWADEFNANKLDTTSWNIEVNGHGGGNNELQYYVNSDKNLRLEDGNLVIEAIKESYKGKEYTSARINTKGKKSWQYGKIESRMKLPYGQGIWPAFWMLGENISKVGWPRCGEIDIMEMIGSTEGDKTTYSTLHWFGDSTHEYLGNNLKLETGRFADDYHVFSTIWKKKEFTFFCDNKLVFQIDISAPEYDEFRANFHILFNLAVGGNWPGNPDSTTVFPQKMLVDWVRVYQLK